MHRRANPAARASNPTGKTCSGYRYGCLSLHTMIHKKTAPQNRGAGGRESVCAHMGKKVQADRRRQQKTEGPGRPPSLPIPGKQNLVIKINNPASIQTFSGSHPEKLHRQKTFRREICGRLQLIHFVTGRPAPKNGTPLRNIKQEKAHRYLTVYAGIAQKICFPEYEAPTR